MEVYNPKQFGQNLKVPSVVELSKKKLESVPSRYIRSDDDQDHSLIMSPDNASPQEIPVISLQNLLNGEDDLVNAELEKFHLACKEWGFFQLIDHGLSLSLMEKVKSDIQAFLNLPAEEKKKLEQQPHNLEGFGQHFVLSEDQKLEWADIFYLHTQPIDLRNSGIFAKLQPRFRETLEVYSGEMQEIATKILNQMAKALGIKGSEMNNIFGEGMQSMRMNYYPPCPKPELVIGISPHSDAGTITLLLQLTDVVGLQIKKDGAWIPVVPLPNAFIINVGDSLEILTNGIYKSVEHRGTVNEKLERLSFATFLNPSVDAELSPAPSLITPGNPAKYKSIVYGEYLKGYNAQRLSGKSYINAMRI